MTGLTRYRRRGKGLVIEVSLYEAGEAYCSRLNPDDEVAPPRPNDQWMYGNANGIEPDAQAA